MQSQADLSILELSLCDDSDSIYLDTESPDSIVETFPIISDVLKDSFSGISLNIQGLLSKSTEVWQSYAVSASTYI